MTTLRRLAPAALLLPLGACDWFTDFKDQPRIEPWESYALEGTDTAVANKMPFRGQPQFSVPVTGAVAPGYWVSYQPVPATLDSLSALQTPNAPTPAALENGRRHYQINCAVCHGAAGAGDGPVTLYGYPAPSLLTPQAAGYSDGYLFGIIRNGRGLMPTYNRIEEPDRWDVVNYIRGLQGRYAVETTPAGYPGATGTALPGYTATAPTRPAPYFQPFVFPRDSSAATGALPGPTAEIQAPPVPGAPPAAQGGVRPPVTPPATNPPDSSARPGGRN